MSLIRIMENIERRYLGAVCFVDNTTKGMVRRRFDIKSKGLNFIVNPSYLHVIKSAEGLENHIHSFMSQPDQPAIKSIIFNMTISDPLQKYLPRIKQVELPRNPVPDPDDSLFKPIRVAMFPSSCENLNQNWSIIRASAYRFEPDDTEQPLGGALLRVIRENDHKLIASGITDDRGEAIIIAPGIPFHNYVTDEDMPDDGGLNHDDWLASGEVAEKETSVKLKAVVDSALPWPVDPEVLEENCNIWLCSITLNKKGDLKESVDLKLKPGQTQIIKIYINVPDGT